MGTADIVIGLKIDKGRKFNMFIALLALERLLCTRDLLQTQHFGLAAHCYSLLLIICI